MGGSAATCDNNMIQVKISSHPCVSGEVIGHPTFRVITIIAVCFVFVTFIADKVTNLVCGVFIFAVHAISRVTI